MLNPIYPCIWYDGQAGEAAKFYCSVFKNSKIIVDTPMVVNYEIEGVKIMGLNGGSQFKVNPSISLFVTCNDFEEVEYLWGKLSDGGSIMMPLDKYDWSEKYGWCVDKYGLSWQIFKGNLDEVKQKIVPAFLFVNKQFGNAKEAVNLYTSLFKNSEIQGMLLYPDGGANSGAVMHSQFKLGSGVFMAMDGVGDHKFDFNEGISLVVECETQEEIDFYWNSITKEGEESMCGWCKDKFGVSWQIIPSVLKSLMTNPEKSKRVMTAFLKMKKFDIQSLVDA